ncbi:MAG: ECF transporter S component, partial [Clostridia bacterium]|nr:ECF transporter S component [Clostridia bacterium]
LSPMHIPVLLCGFVCGWPWGLIVGGLAPILRSLIFSMPPMFPVAFAMTFELATYGLVAGLLYKLLPKKTGWLYFELIAAMTAGRVVWGIVRFAIAGLGGSEFSFAAFLAGAVTSAVPGIILHIVLIPLIVLALKKADLIENS